MDSMAGFFVQQNREAGWVRIRHRLGKIINDSDTE